MADVVKLLARAAPRWGLLALALGFGGALMGTALRARRDARAAEQVMARAQGEGLLQRMRRELGPRGTADPADLAAIVESYEELGLRYLAVRDHGRIVAEAGAPQLPGVIPPPGELAVSGERYRFRLLPRMMRRPPRIHDSGPRPRFGPPDPPEGIELLIEFDAAGASEIRQRSLVMLWVSSGATLLLMAAALFLSRLLRQSQDMVRAMERQRHLATLGEMSAVMAHEIRNPLASLKGHAQLLAEEVTEGKPRTRVIRVVDEAIRLERLTNDLLAFARSAEVKLAPVSPAELLAAAAAGVTRGRVQLDAAGAPALFPLDGPRMQRVLANLLDNAVDASDQPVEAAVAEHAGGLAFTVRDHGPGVPPEDRERVFEAFITGKSHGTGLGLAVARRIVELHGGRLTVEAAPGGGALFRAFIPAPRS
jgi:two-component system, NtrC family, sensor histidine kinase HydH